jgi:hypothetical protein
MTIQLARRPVVVGSVLLCSFLGTFSAVSSFGAFSSEPEPAGRHTGGPVTEHRQVTAATSEEFGDFRVVQSEDARGSECIGIEYTDQFKTRVQAEACDISSTEPFATLVGRHQTLVVGRVPTRTATATLDTPGQSEHLVVREGDIGGGPFVVAVLGRSQVPDAAVTVRDAQGVELARYPVRANAGPDDRAAEPAAHR